MHFAPPHHAKKLASFSRSKIYQALFVSTLCLGTTSVALADSGLVPSAPELTGAYATGVGAVASGGKVVIDTKYADGTAISGGHGDSGASANNNHITIVTGAKVTSVWGGDADGDAIGNTVTINGHATVNNVWGGEAGSGKKATENTVNLTNATIIAGLVGGTGITASDIYTGNTLVLTGQNTAGNVAHFENYQFNDGATLKAETVKLNNPDNSKHAKIQINQSGGNLLSAGTELTLIEATSSTAPKPIDGTLASATTSGLGGATILYDYTLDIVGDKKLVATVTGSKANPRAKALSEGMVGSVSFINQGADLATSRGMDAALSATAGATANAPKIAAFGVAQGGHSRYKTGSNVNVDGASLMLGVGFNLANDLGNFLVAPFVEGGWGNYSSHNSFNNAAAVSGGGDSYYFGVGSLFREDFTEGRYGHPYAEASLRVGRSVTKFSSKDLKDFSGTNARYRSENIYYGAHVGGGYILNLQDKATLDTYAKYFYTRQDSDNVTLPTNDKVHFDAVDSNRLRVGTRYNHNITVDGFDLKPYVGVAFEREFSGKAKASTYGHKIDAPTLRGNTGMLEVGLSFKPQSIQNMSIDFGVEGYTGRREGIVGSLKAYYAF